MFYKLILSLIISSFIFSNDETEKYSWDVFIGAGSVQTPVPDFIGDFAVNDASASNSTYQFKANRKGAESYSPFIFGFKRSLTKSIGLETGLEPYTCFVVGYGPIVDSTYIAHGQFTGGLDYRMSKNLKIGAGIGLGYIGYNVEFTVDRESASDIYMTYQDATDTDIDIYFDDNGEALATLKKNGFLIAPEFNAQFKIGSIGLQLRLQQFLHIGDASDPWKINFSETNVYSSEPASVEIEYTGSYVNDSGTQFPTLDLNGTQITLELAYYFKRNI